MALRGKTKSNIAFAVCGIAVAVLLLIALTVGHFQKAAVYDPNPMAGGMAYAADHDDGFPVVDWDHWLSVNEDIVGWITIEGTNVNHPIVQEQPGNAGYYLNHDVYGNWSPWGAIYLDAACMGDGLKSPNAVIYGHNMGWDDTMFADIAKYSDWDYATCHRIVMIQTPTEKMRTEVVATDVISGWSQAKRTAFDDEGDRRSWFEKQVLSSDNVMKEELSESKPMYSLVTCSYNHYGNERTIAYTQ